MMKRQVLIVSPHFPPINAPDHQRVRMSLPYFRKFGWAPTVLAVRPESVEGLRDPSLEQTVPASVLVRRTGAFSARLTRKLGLGSLALRALPFLWRAGKELLDSEKFDLIYFSTTMFPVMILGPIWKRRFGLPYVIDFQDPWRNDYYERTGVRPPGGKLKYGLSRLLARTLEPRIVRQCREFIVVSPAYAETLLRQYPLLRGGQFTVIPFGAPDGDFKILRSLRCHQTIFERSDGKLHWSYVGAAGPMMRPALRIFFSAVNEARQREPKQWNNVRLHFVGTNYASNHGGEITAISIADECGISDLVDERTDRVPYFEALQVLVESDGILVIGSDSPSYSPSKLYPCILARRPMLSILHQGSPAVEILRRCHAGTVVTFAPDGVDGETEAEMVSALDAFRRECENEIVPEIDWNYFEQFTAREMARRQCAVFNSAMNAEASKSDALRLA